MLPAGSVDAVFVADVDVDNFPLSHEEGALATLAAKLGAAPMELEPAARLRDLFDRAGGRPQPRGLARVTHDRQAKDRYSAAMWTELTAAVRAAGRVVTVTSVGEGDIAADLDTAAGMGLKRRRVACLPPQSWARTPSATWCSTSVIQTNHRASCRVSCPPPRSRGT
ncbi:MAG: hypothetical protein ACLTKG_01995 [Collinsella intestinalis]